MKEKNIKVFTPDEKVSLNEIRDFSPKKLESNQKLSSYQEIKKTYGPLAATDPDKKSMAAGNSKFALNEASRQRLHVDQEEQKKIDEKVKNRVFEMASQAQETAKKSGYQDGLKSGYDEGMKKAREEFKAHVTKLDRFLEACEGAKTEIIKANERLILESIFQICRMVLQKEIKQDPEYLMRLCRTLIEKLDSRENIRVQVNQADLESMSKLREYLEKTLGEMKNVNIEASTLVQAGGIVVDAQWGAIEANLEGQLKGIHDALVGAKEG